MRPVAVAQSHVRFPLSSLFASGAAVRVLRLLAMQAQPVSLPLIAQQTKLSRNGVALILENLAGQRAVQMYGSGRTQMYQLDMNYPLAAALQALFLGEQAHWTELLQNVRHALDERPQVKSAWYFGSVARGEDTPRSDFDIGLVVSSDSEVDAVTESVRESLRPVGERFFVAFSVIGLSDADVIRLHREQDQWWHHTTNDARSLKGPGPRDYAESITR